jgi:hypothetical protein
LFVITIQAYFQKDKLKEYVKLVEVYGQIKLTKK